MTEKEAAAIRKAALADAKKRMSGQIVSQLLHKEGKKVRKRGGK